jgi:flagellar basal body-associated protein FliL
MKRVCTQEEKELILKNKKQMALVLLALILAIVQVHPVILILGGALAGYWMTRDTEAAMKSGKAGDSR